MADAVMVKITTHAISLFLSITLKDDTELKDL